MGNFVSYLQKPPSKVSPEPSEDGFSYSSSEMGIATDAAGVQDASGYQFPLSPKLTFTNVLDIEMDLDFNEKVSMGYLLYDNAEVALQYLIQLQNGSAISILQEWITSTKCSSWSTKLLEALSIIQNYKLLHNCGYTPDEVNQRFLPLNGSTSIEIDLTKKKLYHLCEDLTSDRLQILLNKVEKDFKDKKLNFRTFPGNFLEMYILHWISIKYITPLNFKNLAKVFKLMDMLEIADYLTSIGELQQIPANVQVKVRHHNERYLDDVSDIPLSRSMSSGSSVTTQDRVRNNSYCSYQMNEDRPGVCLIINQDRFYTEPEPSLQSRLPKINGILERREGTEFDCARIKNTMEKFGYKIYKVNNLDHIGIVKTVTKVVNDVTEDDSSLFVYILSHGIKGKIYGNNSIPLEVDQIKKIMCEKNTQKLSGKPKVLLIQACQGTECQEVTPYDENDITMDGPAATSHTTPKAADMLVFWATVPGFSAIRDKKKGTWFIQSLCDNLEDKSAEFHFEDICTIVIQDVINKRWGQKAMVPIKESTFSASLFLPKMKCFS